MIREISILTAYLLTEFAIYIMAYKVIFQKRINCSVHNWMTVIIIIGIVHGITYVYADLYYAMSISMFSMIVIPSFLLEKRDKEGFLLYPIVLMGTSVFAVSGTYVMALLFSIPEDKLTKGNLLTILCQMIPIFILIALQLSRHCKKKITLRLELSRQQYVLFYIVIIIMCMILSN